MPNKVELNVKLSKELLDEMKKMVNTHVHVDYENAFAAGVIFACNMALVAEAETNREVSYPDIMRAALEYLQKIKRDEGECECEGREAAMDNIPLLPEGLE